MLLVVGAAVWAMGVARRPVPPEPTTSLVTPAVAVVSLPGAAPLDGGGAIDELSPPVDRWEGVVGRADSFYSILTGHGVAPARVLAMVAPDCGKRELSHLVAGQPYTVTCDPESDAVEFRYRTDADHDYVARLEGEQFSARLDPVAWDIRLRHIAGTINSSIFENLQARGVGDAIPMKLAVIFGWDIEFAIDIRPGDRYNLLFQEKWRDGKFVEYGKVVAATLTVQGEDHTAIYYKDGSGYEEYYDPSGRSLTKQFLRSPVNYTRISSNFTYHRLHPILRVYRPHLGVDLAAPVGTPVRAVGAGRVAEVERKGAAGKMVRIRHNDRYETAYLHLSRYAEGVRPGARVRQGQVIGYVGATGRATGPHLDYRFYVHGEAVNPMTIKSPAAEPVKEAYRANFLRLAAEYQGRLVTEPAETVIASSR
ncbi:MAG: peptidoglycan DD-metalloendopeptidase family protein [Deltaproteobacteria bacterium]|nr:peptidoglycan DD-metalloendopeptidase family protein [Deltaproteobacteria bacterium]NCP96023.1 peptidoglycan DD-metalloendopeptidase family protein [Deltaproteobacteria bacterium]NCS73721.1 peptidoglycan DD-metalloendopeptidase family protein [Deltaproteobacteria bacterium]